MCMGSSKYHYSYITIISRIYYWSDTARLLYGIACCVPFRCAHQRCDARVCGIGLFPFDYDFFFGDKVILDDIIGDSLVWHDDKVCSSYGPPCLMMHFVKLKP